MVYKKVSYGLALAITSRIVAKSYVIYIILDSQLLTIARITQKYLVSMHAHDSYITAIFSVAIGLIIY